MHFGGAPLFFTIAEAVLFWMGCMFGAYHTRTALAVASIITISILLVWGVAGAFFRFVGEK